MSKNKEMNDHPRPNPPAPLEGGNKEGNKEGSELREKANEVFTRYTVDVLYATSDGMLFITKEGAANQAHNLGNHEILIINKQTE